jgi:histidine triad (HIT) family protein
MSTIFTRIANKEIPSHLIAEDENFYAFLDINPVAEGHTLVIPKAEVDYIFDLDNDTFVGLHLFARKVAVAIEKAIPCQRIGVIVFGLEVPHAHIHLIPINKSSDMNITAPKLKLTPEQLSEIAQKIRKFVS